VRPAHAAELESLGYDERFRRLWTLYLAYCEAGFAERPICDVQVLLAKPHCRLRSLRLDRDSSQRLPLTDAWKSLTATSSH
jgi:hypothetical protein